MSIEEAAKQLGISKGRVRSLVKSGRINGVRTEEGVLSLTPSSVQDYAQSRRVLHRAAPSTGNTKKRRAKRSA